jgi:polyketide synthase PksN
LRSGVSRSICWGQWEVDGAIDPDKLPARLERLRQRGLDFIDAPAAMSLMETTLRGRAEVTGFVAVSDADAARRALGLEPATLDDERIFAAVAAFERGEWTRLQFAELLDALPDNAISAAAQQAIVAAITSAQTPAREVPVAPKPKPASPPATPRASPVRPNAPTSIRQALGGSVERVLKIKESEIDWNEPLPNYGLDSIVAMQLATALEKALKFPIQPRWLVEFPTLHQLVEKLNQEHQAKEDRDALR